MLSHCRVVWLLLVLVSAVLLVGCDRGSEPSSAWTVEEGALRLERDLLVSETEAFYFGNIADLAVASDGRMFVLDWDARHVKMLDPEGILLDSLGGKGQGPGEFQRPRQIVVGRGDSLFVLDDRSRRISVFAPSGQFVRGVPFESAGAATEGLNVPGAASGFLMGQSSVFVSEDEEPEYVVRRLDASGTVLDTLIRAPAEASHMVSRGQIRISIPIPYAPSPTTVLGPKDVVHFARSDRLTVRRLAIDGTPQDTVTVPFEPVPVTEADEERVLEGYSEQRPMPANKIPATKPAFSDFLVDDQGRYWFGRWTAHPDTTAWWVADPEEKTVATARVSDEIDILTVRGGFAYGDVITEAGAPAVVRYRVRFRE